MISAAALPVASCHGSVLISAGMKVTEDDKQPNAFFTCSWFQTQMPQFKQMGMGRSNYSVGWPSACAHDGTLWWSCHTLHAWPPLPYNSHAVSTFTSKESKDKIFGLIQRLPRVVQRFLFPSENGSFMTLFAWWVFSCVHLLQEDRLFITLSFLGKWLGKFPRQTREKANKFCM